MSTPHGKTIGSGRPSATGMRAIALPPSWRRLGLFLAGYGAPAEFAPFYAPYEDETRGAPPFDPAMMVCLSLYTSCVGVFSSRKIAQACERNLAFIAIVGTERPDFRTISDFRKLPLDTFREVFEQVLRIAGEAGMVQLGTIATEGRKSRAMRRGIRLCAMALCPRKPTACAKTLRPW